MSAEQFPEVTSTAGRARHFARTRRRERSAQPAFREAGATFLFGGDPSNRLVAPEWPKMAIPMALALAGLALFNLSIPTILPALLALLALVATHFSSIAVKIESERKLETGQRLALMGLAVALPMFLFGSAMGFWGESGQVAWFGCLAVVVTTGVLATVVQSGRLVAVIAAQVGIWSGVTCVASRAGGYFALVLGVAIAIAAYLRQRKIDLHARKKSESDQRAQTRAEEILADYEETGQGWFWETDRRGHLAYLSSPVAAILGRRVEELVGRPFSELFNLTEQSGEGERTLAFHLSARSSFSELAVRAATRDEERWWSITGRPTYDTFNNFAGFRGSGTDLTEKRRSQEHASRLAHFDSLTGLSNRFRMSQTLEKILLAPQVQHRACAVFLLDLDRFKQVNDTLGHPAGDALLKQVAQRLERVVGKIGRVGRLGGDEFEVILPGKMEDRKSVV